jgi:hypothetical protein
VKWLLILAGAVLLLLAAWFFLGRSGSSTPVSDQFILEVPAPAQGKAALVRAAQQFLKVDPKNLSVHEGCALLRVVTEGLSDEDWPPVQAACFRGFGSLHPIQGSREALETVLEKLLDRFVHFGSVAELEALVRWSNENVYWKAQVDRFLLAAVSKEVPASGPSQLVPILEASIRQKDYERAGAYVSKARFAEGVAEQTRTPVVRLETALRLHYETKKENPPPMATVIREWAALPEDRLSGPLHLATGIELARLGQPNLDFRRLKQAMADTKSQERAGEYWEKVLLAYGDLLPASGSYMEAPALEALVNSYGDLFKKKSFECEFWKKVAEKITSKTVGEGMWRVECLKHAFRAAAEDGQKVALLKEIAQGYRTYMPGAARQIIESLAAQIEGAGAKAEVAAILEDARKTDAEQQARQKKLDQELAVLPFKTQAEALKRQLVQAKENHGSPELIQKLERQIKEIEKKLPE